MKWNDTIMINLTPTIILQFNGKSSLKETYKVVINNILDIVKTMTDKDEIRSTKLQLLEAIAILTTEEERGWARENGIDTHF